MTLSSLSQYDRGAIYQLLKDGCSQRQIATRLNVSTSTINYELKRVFPYDPIKAQYDADTMRKHCGRHYTINNVKRTIIEDYLKLTWSPEEIANYFHFCTASIYKWIYRGLVDFQAKYLPEKNKRHKRKYEQRGHLLTAHGIEERSLEVNDRKEFGHWESDTVLSSRGESKSCLATFVERKSRFLWAIKIPNRTSDSMEEALDQFFNKFNSSIKSITTDHGREFSQNIYFEDKYKTTFYSCHPYSPWERGTNERLNKSLRRFFPKKTNFELITPDQVLESLELINGRPFKVLNGHTAIETFRDNFLKCSD